MPHEKKSYVKIYKRKREPVRITDEDETPEKVMERLKMKEAEEKGIDPSVAGVQNDEKV